MERRTSSGIRGGTANLIPAVAAGVVWAALPTGAQTQLFELRGAGAGDRFGASVCGVGDIDQDGYDDFAVGANQRDTLPLPGNGYAVVYSGRDLHVLNQLQGDFQGDGLGSGISGAGFGGIDTDIDGDGVPDYLVGASWGKAVAAGPEVGYVLAVSGATGGVIHQVYGPLDGSRFGTQTAIVGDLTGDGRAEFLVSAVLDSTCGTKCGSAWLYDGEAGTALWTEYGNSAGDWYGSDVTAAGDWNGDGTLDFAVGAYGDSKPPPLPGPTNEGAYFVYSGAGYGLLHASYGGGSGENWGYKLGHAGDVNGDGESELVISAIQSGVSGTTPFRGLVAVRPTGLDYSGSAAYDRFGQDVAGLGDVDGDGFLEVVGGASMSVAGHLGTGYVRVFHAAGPSGSVFVAQGDAVGDYFGSAVESAGDVNADGLPDLIVGAQQAHTGAEGYVRVFTAVDLSLTADGYSISVSSGGSQTLTLDAGSAHANELYWVVGSWSGVSPGILVDGQLLPINPDDYTQFTIRFANVPPFGSTFGTLDAQGTAVASFTLGAGGSPILVGLELVHAFLAFGPVPSVVFTSNAVPLLLDT